MEHHGLARCWVLRKQARRPAPACCGGWCGWGGFSLVDRFPGRPVVGLVGFVGGLFENCTVDASIFDL